MRRVIWMVNRLIPVQPVNGWASNCVVSLRNHDSSLLFSQGLHCISLRYQGNRNTDGRWHLCFKDKAFPTNVRHPLSKLSLLQEILRATGKTSYVAITPPPHITGANCNYPVRLVCTSAAALVPSATSCRLLRGTKVWKVVVGT